MPRPYPESLTDQAVYDHDYAVFMGSLLLLDDNLRDRLRHGMALMDTWVSMVTQNYADPLLGHIKLQWWADTLAQGRYDDHPLLKEAPRDLMAHPTLPIIVSHFRAFLAQPPQTEEAWMDHLTQTFGQMGAIIHDKDVGGYAAYGALKYRQYGQIVPALPALWPKKQRGDHAIMGRIVRAVGQRKNIKSPMVLLRLWVG